jgi:hypothetical protein
VERLVIRPRIQVALLIAVFSGFGLIGVMYFANDVIARRD